MLSMKKLTAIFFLTACLITATGVCEFFKISILDQHTNETKGNDGKGTYLHFLVSHFLNDEYNDESKQWLFKSPVEDISNSFPAFNLLSRIQPFNLSFLETNRTAFLILNRDLAATKHNRLVWHPPNIVTAYLRFVLIMIE